MIQTVRRLPRTDGHSSPGTQTAAYRVGIIGFGQVGRRRAELVNVHPRLKLTAIADPKVHGAQVLFPDCACYLDAADLLRSEDLHAVFVCTPNAATTDLVIRALEAGRHVFAEKPAGRSLGDIQRIRDAETRSPGLCVKFGFNHREHDSVHMSRSLIASGELGRLMWMRGTYGKGGGPDYEEGWRADPDIAGGGILLDQGIHMLDLFRLFGGEFPEVKSFVGQSFWKSSSLEDNAFALLRGADGCVAMLHSSATHWNHTFRLEMYLTDGYLVLEGFLTGSRSYGRETLVIGRRDWNDLDAARGRPHEERYYFDEDRSWQREIDDFVQCMSAPAPVTVGSSLDAQRVMELVTRVYADDAWRSGR